MNIEYVTIYFITPNGDCIKAIAKIGENLLFVAHKYGVKIKANCGGVCACTTCHCYIEENYFDSFTELYDISDNEMDKLETSSLIEYNSRLICQLSVTKKTHNIKIRVAENSYGEPSH